MIKQNNVFKKIKKLIKLIYLDFEWLKRADNKNIYVTFRKKFN